MAMCDALRVDVFLSLIIQAVWRHTALHAALIERTTDVGVPVV